MNFRFVKLSHHYFRISVYTLTPMLLLYIPWTAYQLLLRTSSGVVEWRVPGALARGICHSKYQLRSYSGKRGIDEKNALPQRFRILSIPRRLERLIQGEACVAGYRKLIQRRVRESLSPNNHH